MIFRPSRTRSNDPFVGEKMLAFSIGAVLAVTGIVFDLGWLIYVAIGVLVLGFLLRFVPKKG